MHIPMQDKKIFVRTIMRSALLADLHRPKGSTGFPVDQYVAEAKARLTRPRPEKAEYTPPRPSDWVTAFHVTDKCKRATNTSTAKQRKHIACQSKATHKSWGKGGVKLVNLISVAARNKQKLQDEIDYAVTTNGSIYIRLS